MCSQRENINIRQSIYNYVCTTYGYKLVNSVGVQVVSLIYLFPSLKSCFLLHYRYAEFQYTIHRENSFLHTM